MYEPSTGNHQWVISLTPSETLRLRTDKLSFDPVKGQQRSLPQNKLTDAPAGRTSFTFIGTVLLNFEVVSIYCIIYEMNHKRINRIVRVLILYDIYTTYICVYIYVIYIYICVKIERHLICCKDRLSILIIMYIDPDLIPINSWSCWWKLRPPRYFFHHHEKHLE